MLGLYFANLHICDEQNAQNCIFFTTAKVVNKEIGGKKSANILIYFKDKINEKYTNETYRA